MKPKVLFILHLPPPTYGATIVGSYIKQSHFINDELEADYVNLATNRVLTELGRGTFKKLFTFTDIIKQVFNSLRQKNYDLCYVTLTAKGGAFYKDLLVVSVLKMFGKKVVYHFHNKGISEVKGGFNKALYKYAFNNSKSILLSNYLYPDIQNYVSKNDVYYCPCGIPVTQSNNFDLEEKQAAKPAGSACQLLFLSNMMREKGIYVLLEACKKLKSRNIPFECHFIGGWIDVTESSFKQQIKELGLEDVVFAHGPKYNEEKLAWYRRAEVFIFPTYYHYEAFPLVNLEAMQSGLPVISTREGGIPEMIVEGETGFLIPKKDADALAEKLTVLIQNPELRASMGEAGKKRFFDYFTLAKFEQNLTHILKTIVRQN